MARRKDHTREELKDLILETSFKIVEEEGFQALTARRIAKDIGYAPGTIYNLFSSMDALYLHVNARTMEKLYQTLSQVNPKKNLQNQLFDMARLYFQFTQDHKNEWLMLFQHQMPDGQEYPDWFAQDVAKIFHPLESVLKARYDNKMRLQMAARGLWASIHGIIFLEATEKIPGIDGQAPSSLDLAQFMIVEYLKKA